MAESSRSVRRRRRASIESVLRPVANPFSADGGLKVLDGNLGRAVIKISAVAPEHRKVRARARVFHAQEEVEAAFGAANSIAISSRWFASRA